MWIFWLENTKNGIAVNIDIWKEILIYKEKINKAFVLLSKALQFFR